MLRKPADDEVLFECPECGAPVKMSSKEAEKGTARCPNGHEFALMGMLGGGGDLS